MNGFINPNPSKGFDPEIVHNGFKVLDVTTDLHAIQNI